MHTLNNLSLGRANNPTRYANPVKNIMKMKSVGFTILISFITALFAGQCSSDEGGVNDGASLAKSGFPQGSKRDVMISLLHTSREVLESLGADTDNPGTDIATEIVVENQAACDDATCGAAVDLTGTTSTGFTGNLDGNSAESAELSFKLQAWESTYQGNLVQSGVYKEDMLEDENGDYSANPEQTTASLSYTSEFTEGDSTDGVLVQTIELSGYFLTYLTLPANDIDTNYYRSNTFSYNPVDNISIRLTKTFVSGSLTETTYSFSGSLLVQSIAKSPYVLSTNNSGQVVATVSPTEAWPSQNDFESSPNLILYILGAGFENESFITLNSDFISSLGF